MRTYNTNYWIIKHKTYLMPYPDPKYGIEDIICGTWDRCQGWVETQNHHVTFPRYDCISPWWGKMGAGWGMMLLAPLLRLRMYLNANKFYWLQSQPSGADWAAAAGWSWLLSPPTWKEPVNHSQTFVPIQPWPRVLFIIISYHHISPSCIQGASKQKNLTRISLPLWFNESKFNPN